MYDWILKDNTCLVIVLMLYMLLFLALAIMSVTSWQTSLLCFLIATMCGLGAAYYQSSRSAYMFKKRVE